MRPVLTVYCAFAASWPAMALAEGAGGSYRGAGSISYTFIWVVLCYGLYDIFGRTVTYIGAPILALVAYLALPPG